jgi:Glycosyltransferase 61
MFVVISILLLIYISYSIATPVKKEKHQHDDNHHHRHHQQVLKGIHGNMVNFSQIIYGMHFNSSYVFKPELQNHAAKQSIFHPDRFDVGICNNAHISHNSRVIICDADPEELPLIPYIDLDVAVAYNFQFRVFQHDFIDGLPLAGMLTDWVREDPDERGFLCREKVCDVLSSMTPESHVIDQSRFNTSFIVRSFRVPLQNSTTLQSLNCYPIGSTSIIMRDYLASKFGATITTDMRKILYLSRGNKNNTRHVLNEDTVIETLQTFSLMNGYELDVFEHPTNRTTEEQIETFHDASIVFGLHGGAFTNMVYCNSNVTIIELNNLVGRQCFGCLANELQINYERIEPDIPFNYYTGEVEISQSKLNEIVSVLERVDSST